MISWNLLLGGKTLSEQAYAIISSIVGRVEETTTGKTPVAGDTFDQGELELLHRD